MQRGRGRSAPPPGPRGRLRLVAPLHPPGPAQPPAPRQAISRRRVAVAVRERRVLQRGPQEHPPHSPARARRSGRPGWPPPGRVADGRQPVPEPQPEAPVHRRPQRHPLCDRRAAPSWTPQPSAAPKSPGAGTSGSRGCRYRRRRRSPQVANSPHSLPPQRSGPGSRCRSLRGRGCRNLRNRGVVVFEGVRIT